MKFYFTIKKKIFKNVNGNGEHYISEVNKTQKDKYCTLPRLCTDPTL